MQQMKAMISKIDNLERRASYLRTVLEFENPTAIHISLIISSKCREVTIEDMSSFPGMREFLEGQLQKVLDELNPLKERMKLLTELLPKE